jgi:hypothetical protein
LSEFRNTAPVLVRGADTVAAKDTTDGSPVVTAGKNRVKLRVEPEAGADSASSAIANGSARVIFLVMVSSS